MLRNRTAIPNRPCYFQLLIFLYILCTFLGHIRFTLLYRYLTSVVLTYCHMSIRTPMYFIVICLVRHNILVLLSQRYTLTNTVEFNIQDMCITYCCWWVYILYLYLKGEQTFRENGLNQRRVPGKCYLLVQYFHPCIENISNVNLQLEQHMIWVSFNTFIDMEQKKLPEADIYIIICCLGYSRCHCRTSLFFHDT